MGVSDVPRLPPVTSTWHPSTWWESHDAPPDASVRRTVVSPGDTVTVSRPDGSTTSLEVGQDGELHDLRLATREVPLVAMQGPSRAVDLGISVTSR
ncbi:hypothetical protein [Cellulosimicrobium arenosum]|uniref:Uncharacterized protein n=1 Tax=Cellulosimicrobium arenosum TaxID=2708133 RepID=A0A927PEQ4_9MICO|nr:hypothetical protein [Cellulosimicrobium arenosum]MBD8080013.1 hypothetical protein [Cellulosimicrobium arenosum]